MFEETGCAVCVKGTSIFLMAECSEVENINLLKVDGVTRKAKSMSKYGYKKKKKIDR